MHLIGNHLADVDGDEAITFVVVGDAATDVRTELDLARWCQFSFP
jgi:hypothetical protein